MSSTPAVSLTGIARDSADAAQWKRIVRRNIKTISADYLTVIDDQDNAILHDANDNAPRSVTINNLLNYENGTTITVLNPINSVTVRLNTGTLQSSAGNGPYTVPAGAGIEVFKVNSGLWLIMAGPSTGGSSGGGGTVLPSYGPANSDLFDSWVNSNMTLLSNYQFGSAASSGTPIKNATDLGTYFNNLMQLAGVNSFNGEWQRYQPFTDTSVFSWGTDYMQITANASRSVTLDKLIRGGLGASGFQNIKLDNTPTPLSYTDASDTTGIVVGQVAWYPYRGVYRVTAVVANTSFTLQAIAGSSTSTYDYYYAYPLAFTKARVATITVGTGNNPSTIVVGAGNIPSGVTVGDTVAFSSANGIPNSLNYNTLDNNNYVVSALDNMTGTITLSNVRWFTPLNVGDLIWFFPLIKSGQCWHKTTYKPGIAPFNPRLYAFQLELKGPGDGTNNPPPGWADVIPADILTRTDAHGGWPAFWIFDSVSGNSEIDWFEFFYGSIISDKTWTCHPNSDQGYQQPYAPLTWNSGGQAVLPTGRLSDGFHKFSGIWDKDYVYYYYDGALCNKIQYTWAGNNGEIGFNLACGVWGGSICYNLGVLPMHANHMTYMNMKIKSLKIWKLD